MLTIEATEQIAPFLARKQAQWERFAGRIPGLGLVRSGQYGTSLMIYCSTETFYEATVIGQLAQRVPHVVGRGISRRIIDTPDRQKTVDKRGIDMTQAALARNCALRADLTIALAKIKQLEASIGTKPPAPVEAQTGEAEAMNR